MTIEIKEQFAMGVGPVLDDLVGPGIEGVSPTAVKDPEVPDDIPLPPEPDDKVDAAAFATLIVPGGWYEVLRGEDYIATFTTDDGTGAYVVGGHAESFADALANIVADVKS